MTNYKISQGERYAEAVSVPEGIRITAGKQGETIPYFQAFVQDMLTYSTGKPWRLQAVKLEQAQLSATSDEIVVQGMAGSLSLQLRLSFDSLGLLKWDIAWENTSKDILRDTAVGVLFPMAREESSDVVTIPHILYNNNPSSDPNRLVPKLGVGPDKGIIFEEHRLPIPAVNREWQAAGASRYMTVFSIPSYIEREDGSVHYGSLGAIQEEHKTVIAALSGVLMLNGERDVQYVHKSISSPKEEGYLDLAPGFVLSKQYTMDFGVAAKKGHGFRTMVHKALELYNPQGAKPLSASETVRLKMNAMDDRWRTNEAGAAGYVKFSDSNSFGFVNKKHSLHYMYGWTGQALKLALCDAKLGFDGDAPSRIERCVKAVNFYLEGSKTDVPGARHGAYQLASQEWEDFSWNRQKVVSSRAYGETISDLADIIILFREEGREVPEAWLTALHEAVKFIMNGPLPSGIYPAAWLMDGAPADEMVTAAGIPCAMAVLKAYQATGEQAYLEEAEKVLGLYAALHVDTFEIPFARSTLDAKCEDKEAGMYYFMAVNELYSITKNPLHAEWAAATADWLLTFVYFWNPVYNNGTEFAEADFKAAGWPGVSVQNHHLDVFFPTYEFWQFGKVTKQKIYERMGRMSFEAMGQGICRHPGDWKFDIIGEQAEGFFQTNWQNRGACNTWNPSWVTAVVLHNALRFQDEE